MEGAKFWHAVGGDALITICLWKVPRHFLHPATDCIKSSYLEIDVVDCADADHQATFKIHCKKTVAYPPFKVQKYVK